MKAMTCSQLGGACEEAFRTETIDEVAEMSREFEALPDEAKG